MKNTIPFAILLIIISSCSDDDDNEMPVDRFTVDSVFVNNSYVPNNSSVNNVDYDDVEIRITFSDEVDTSVLTRPGLSLQAELTHYIPIISRMIQEILLSVQWTSLCPLLPTD
jgi:hypothetical protein